MSFPEHSTGNHAHEHSEHVVAAVQEHWIRYVFPLCIYLFLMTISGVLLFLAEVIAHHWMWVSHGVFLLSFSLLVLTHHGFFLYLLGESMSQVVVTNRRIIYFHDELFLHHEMLEFNFNRLKMVESHQHGLLQNLLHYGELKFDTGPSVPYVWHPNRVARDIQQAMGKL